MCCDGGLFHSVDLNDDDRTRLAAAGFEAPARLVHPCPHFARPACAVYAVRPWRCADYRCRVLDALDERRIDEDAAHDRVREARTLRARMAEALPPGLTAVALAEDVRSAAPSARAPERLVALARFVAYRLFVERHFLGEKARWMTRTKV